MQQDFKTHFLNILNIIGYQGEKEKFADDFYQVIMQKVLIDKIDILSQDKQILLLQELKQANATTFQKIFIKYFPKKEFAEEVKKQTAVAMQIYFKEVIPTLSTDQKTKLKNYLSSMVA